VVTNKHVIRDGVFFQVKHGKRVWPAQVSHLHPRHDMCQLQVEQLDAPSVSLKDSSCIIVGERVYAIGAPKGFDLTISEGLVSGLRKRGGTTVVQTTAPISSGSSGGGLFDEEGELVGITTFSIVDGQSLNFALLANLILTLEEHPFTGGAGCTDVASEPEQPELEDLAAQKMDERKYGEAVKLWRQALALRPANKNSWFRIGVAYSMVGLHEDAIEAYHQAVRLDPQFGDAWQQLGAGYTVYTKEFDKGIEALNEAIRLQPDNVRAWILLGDAYREKELREDALAAYTEAIRINPEHHHAWYRLGVFHVFADPYSNDGISAMRQAVRLEPDEPDYWYWLALAYRSHRNLGDAQKEAQALNRLEDLDPKLAREYKRDFKDLE
jgi:tetratricopeptide (TPR) repeat protein